MGGHEMGGRMSGSHGEMGRSGDYRQEGRARREDAIARRDTMAPEQAVFGLSTAARAKLLKDADLEARKAFGQYQASLAKAQGGSERQARRNAKMASDVEVSNFGSDTAARARELQSADLATRTAFGKLQSALARAQNLRRAAGAASVNAAFGTDTAARAKMQGNAALETRKTFGADQARRAKAKADADN